MNEMAPGEMSRRITDLERDHAETNATIALHHGQLIEKLGNITTSQAAQGERLGNLEKMSEGTKVALKEYINEQRADKRSIRNILLAAVATVVVEGVILIFVMVNRTGVGG